MSAVEWASVAAGPVGVVLGAYGTSLFNRKMSSKVNERLAEKAEADAASAIASAAVTLVQPLQDKVVELTTRVDTLEAENTTTKTKLQLAIDHIRALRSWIFDHIPDKTPPNPPKDLGL